MNGIAKWIDFAWFAPLVGSTATAQNPPDASAGLMERTR
jgi:hypothetical protein